MTKKRNSRRREATGSGSSVVRRRRLEAGRAGLWLVGTLAIVAFLPTLANEYTNWDDKVNLTDNPFLLPPTWWGFRQLWAGVYENLYVPVFYCSYYLDILLSGGPPRPIVTHLLNLVFHGWNAVFVARLVQAMLQKPSGLAVAPRREDWVGHLPWLVGGLTFATHPIQTEAVAWATGRKDLVAGSLCLGAWLLDERSQRATTPRKAQLLRGAAFVIFVLALLAKPASVALPFAMAAAHWWRERPAAIGLLRRYGLWAIAGGVVMVVTAATQVVAPETSSVLTPWWTRPFVAADAVVFYMRKIVWPWNLAAVYGHTPAVASQSLFFWLALPFVVVLAWLAARADSRLGLAFVLFVVFLAPVLGLVPFAYQRFSTVADRYAYLPMVGVALAVATAVDRLLHRWPHYQRTVIAAAIGLTAGWTMLSWRQSSVWHDSISLWQHSIRVAPHSAVAHANLAAVYALVDRYDEAMAANRRAIELDPLQERAHSNLGLLLLWRNQTTEALAHLKRAVEIRPTFAAPYAHMGDCFAKEGRFEEAAKAYEHALDLDPRNSQAAIGLAYAYYRLGRIAASEDVLVKGLAARPQEPLLWLNYAHLLAETGRRIQAERALEQALTLDPSNEEARRRLEALRKVGQ